jgi:hypothetical protein
MAERSDAHSRTVVTTLAIWIGVHVVLLLGVGVPGYLECRAPFSTTSSIFGGCGASLGLVALAIGWIQLLYGGVVTLILFIRRSLAVGQGVLIGTAAVTFLFTALCFGAAVTG